MLLKVLQIITNIAKTAGSLELQLAAISTYAAEGDLGKVFKCIRDIRTEVQSTSAETCSALEQLLRDVRTVTKRHDAMQYKIAILESQKKHLQGELAKADSENKCFQTSISELYFSGDSTQVSGPSAEQSQPEE